MKEIAEILKKQYGFEIDRLQNLANVVVENEEDQKRFDEFTKHELMEIILCNNDIVEKLIDIAFYDIVKELNIVPNPDYEISEEEKVIVNLAKNIAKQTIEQIQGGYKNGI